MKLGRLAAVRPIGLADFTHYLTSPLPAAPAKVDPPTVEWGMLCNDTLGDCVVAGVVHTRMATAAVHHETGINWPSDDAVKATYFQLTGGEDHGLVESATLTFWHQHGLFGDVLPGYAPFNHRNRTELRGVTAAFGAVLLGVQLPITAQDQFAANQPWDLTHTFQDREIEGGHCIVMVGYDANHAYMVTWGKVQLATWDWVGRFTDESYAVLTSEDDRVDHAALTQDLRRLT